MTKTNIKNEKSLTNKKQATHSKCKLAVISSQILNIYREADNNLLMASFWDYLDSLKGVLQAADMVDVHLGNLRATTIYSSCRSIYIY